MKANRIDIHGTFNADNTVTFEVKETVFTGEGTLDYSMTTTDSGVTEKALYNEDADEDFSFDYFKNKYSKEGFEFDSFIE